MQTLLLLEIAPGSLAELLAALGKRGEILAIRTLHDALAYTPVNSGLDLVAARALLIARGLSMRQCDLVLLDVQGYSRTEIAEHCDLSPATIKKYWLAIYARLGMHRRQAVRLWLAEQCGMAIEPPLNERAVGVPKDSP